MLFIDEYAEFAEREENDRQILTALRGMVETIAQGDLETELCPETKSRGIVQSRDHRGAIVLTVARKISSQYLFYIPQNEYLFF